MSTEPHINSQREVEQGQNTLLHGGARHKMPAFVSALLEHGPGHLLHSFHETCGRRLGCGPRGMPRVHACQGAPFGGQAAADPALQQGQHRPSDSTPPDQAGAMLLPRPLQRGPRSTRFSGKNLNHGYF